MAKMAELHSEGVTDLHSYSVGFEDATARIIKLLENPLHHNIRFPDEHINCYTCELIALIKGENNG
jgi:hypothetical protein